jgi:hypothetical protein
VTPLIASRDMAQYWDDKAAYVVEPGLYNLWVGPDSVNTVASSSIRVTA